MAQAQALKSRIKSVKSTKQVTKAMQLVSASKMRRALVTEKASADYSRSASELLTHLVAKEGTKKHPLFNKRPVKNRLIIVIASDRGLAGAYNSNINKLYLKHLKDDKAAEIGTKTIAIGKRPAQFAIKLEDADVIGVYENLADQPTGKELHAILDEARDLFLSGKVDAVDVVYTKFISTLNQKPTTSRLFPAGFTKSKKVSAGISEAKFEPSQSEVLDVIAYRLIGAQLYQAILDAKASEYSQRMVAMKSATDNASDLIDDLTLVMNKARQAAVTQELSEISGGVEALNS